jgi:hypothetical protein
VGCAQTLSHIPKAWAAAALQLESCLFFLDTSSLACRLCGGMSPNWALQESREAAMAEAQTRNEANPPAIASFVLTDALEA